MNSERTVRGHLAFPIGVACALIAVFSLIFRAIFDDSFRNLIFFNRDRALTLRSRPAGPFLANAKSIDALNPHEPLSLGLNQPNGRLASPLASQGVLLLTEHPIVRGQLSHEPSLQQKVHRAE